MLKLWYLSNNFLSIYTLSYSSNVFHLTFYYFLGGQMGPHVKEKSVVFLNFNRGKMGLIGVKKLSLVRINW